MTPPAPLFRSRIHPPRHGVIPPLVLWMACEKRHARRPGWSGMLTSSRLQESS